MEKSLTLGGTRWPRTLSFFSGIGMVASSLLTVQHYFKANFPESIFEGSFCDISAFFNCDSSAFSPISQILGIPLGYFGLVVGMLVALGALFPSESFERTNTFIAFFNALGAVALFLYTVFVLGSLCLLCSGFYLFSLLSLFLFWRYGIGRSEGRFPGRYLQPSLKLLLTFSVISALGAYGMMALHDAKEDAQAGVSLSMVKQFYELPVVGNPSFISPYWTARATEKFEDAPIHVVEYVDLLCPDCLFLAQQLDELKEEFAGKINIAFQFFPLEGKCNNVVDKNLHPGACDISLYAMYDPSKFLDIHDETFVNFRAARSPKWRLELAARYGVTEAINDPQTQDLLQKIILTGAENEKTSDRFAHGIRSTPTMIINGRMIIGTLPLEHMRAIFLALLEEHE
ncbi:MAG: thioredoxin domain-containing protein, partial [Candidatus Aminicenantes bacterium]|nr:thioredoxin domain-containing protein [Candidatus Aminicenantes bacterium]